MGTAGRMGLVVARVVGLMVIGAMLLTGPARVHAQPSDKSDKSDKKTNPIKSGATASGSAAKPGSGNNSGNSGKPKVFDFTGLDIAGRLRTPQLLYFLERANEELERASLEKRSFVPSMVRSIDDEAL
ncbi:MAG: hypothetical protein KBG15_07605 [Kofleriaceae bacterium]|nr:hypothetical protein [Kofleriaceae bacterium]